MAEVVRGRAKNAWAWNTSHKGKGVVVVTEDEPKSRVTITEEPDGDWVEIHEGPVITSEPPVVSKPMTTEHQAPRAKSAGGEGDRPQDARYQYGSNWPTWVEEFREHQVEGLRGIREAWERGAELIFLDAPTGAGKTLIAEAARREMQVNGLYVCSGKTLQDQFVTDFPYSGVIKGRSNYRPTHVDRAEWGAEVTCADCNKRRMGDGEWDCDYCEVPGLCPYQIAKNAARISEVAVANTAYMLSEANYTSDAVCSGRDLTVVDEADVLEQELMRFVEFSVQKHQVGQLGVTPPKKGSHHSTIIKWLEGELTEAIDIKLAGLPRGTKDVRVARRREAYENMKRRTKQVAREMTEYDGGWVRDNDAGPLVMKPIDVAWAGENLLWRHSARWLLMSATIISAEEMVESLGVEECNEGQGLQWEVVEVPMTFPVENRRIYAIPMANMVAKEKAGEWPKMAQALLRVIERHPGERVLVHCVSFELGRTLKEHLLRHLPVKRQTEMFSDRGDAGPGNDLPRTVITYGSGQGERDKAVAQFRSTEGAVLIAPSLERGVDFREDDCRVVVVCKVPFPYLGDKQVAARANAGRKGRLWYAVQTVRSLVQMTGRHVRSEDDWGVTYILDRQFVSNIYDRNRSLFPKWWRQAVKIESRRMLDG